MTTRTLVTADELLRMPDDGRRYELIEGELIEMAPAGARHSNIGIRIAGPLFQHVDKDDLGELFGADCGFFLQRDPDTIRATDAAFIAMERIPPDGIPSGFIDTISRPRGRSRFSQRQGGTSAGEDRAMDRARREASLAGAPGTALNYSVPFAERGARPSRRRHAHRWPGAAWFLVRRL